MEKTDGTIGRSIGKPMDRSSTKNAGCSLLDVAQATGRPTVMEVASGKNRQNTKENAKIWQFLLKATKLVSLN